jgi:hypothetical protein
MVLFLWMMACSLMGIQYEQCTEDAQCVEAFDEGWECDPDIGYCIEPDTGEWEDTGDDDDEEEEDTGDEGEDTGDGEEDTGEDTGEDDDEKGRPILGVLIKFVERAVAWVNTWIQQYVSRG